jgi:DNA-binding transcriptional ArsR family regulator
MKKPRSTVAAVGPNLAKTAALIGDPVRARMLFTLLDGRELPASELAFLAQSSPQAASSHLSKLVAGGLIVRRSAGRQKFFRLASAGVADAIETLASISPVEPIVSLGQHTAMRRLREARSCYDHLAGKLGVNVTEALMANGAIVRCDSSFELTPFGRLFFRNFDIDVEALCKARRSVVRACMDWTERRHHLAGSLAASLLDYFIARDWLRRNARDRALQITQEGRHSLQEIFQCRLELWKPKAVTELHRPLR